MKKFVVMRLFESLGSAHIEFQSDEYEDAKLFKALKERNEAGENKYIIVEVKED